MSTSNVFILKVLACTIGNIVLFYCIIGTVAQEPSITRPIMIPSADSSTKRIVDSTKIIREEFITQKENLKDKVDFLQWQHKQIKKTQKKIDSIQAKNTVTIALQIIHTISSH
jgi:vacuolar-type H+-ATPase catalytic subunit A/Vma1